MADKTKTSKSLDAKIATALSANGEANRDTLANLIREATKAVEMANIVITAETPRLHDIANSDPDKSQELIASSQLRVERLTKAITQLQARVDQIDHEAAIAKWNEDAKALQAESDQLWRDLEDTYTVLTDQLIDIWHAVDRNSRAIEAARRRRPSGAEHLPLIGADNPALRAKLRLPFWDNPERIRFPRDEGWEFQRAMSDMMVNHAKALEQKYALANSEFLV